MDRFVAIALILLAIAAILFFGESGTPAIIDWCRGCY
jgi:hypothetical protein